MAIHVSPGTRSAKRGVEGRGFKPWQFFDISVCCVAPPTVGCVAPPAVGCAVPCVAWPTVSSYCEASSPPLAVALSAANMSSKGPQSSGPLGSWRTGDEMTSPAIRSYLSAEPLPRCAGADVYSVSYHGAGVQTAGG